MSGSAPSRVNAFVAAGGVPAEQDPLYSFTRGEPKAMLDLAGKPMVQWVLDALNGAESIERIALLGLDEGSGLTSRKPLTHLEDQGGLLQNSLAGLEWGQRADPDADYVLFVSADIPSITPDIVNWRVRQVSGSKVDMDYVAVERSVMEARFPHAHRSFVRFRDVEVCGGDMNMINTRMVVDTELWEQLIGARKSALRQAAVVGFDTLLLLLLRRLTLEQTKARVASSLGLRGRVHLSPHAELAMDLDKPSHLQILSLDLRRRANNDA